MGKVIEPKISSTTEHISKYFRHYEVVRSSTASRKGFDNDIYCPQVAYNAEQLGKNVLDKVRERFGAFGPNSWYRGEELEKDITENAYKNWCAKRSLEVNEESWRSYFARKQHPKGSAADIEISGVGNDDLFEWIKDNLEFDQLIREFPKKDKPMSGWVHVSWSSHGKNRKQAFTIG